MRVGVAVAAIAACLTAAAGQSASANPQSADPDLIFHPHYRAGHFNGVSTNGRYTLLGADRPGGLDTVLDEVTGRRMLLELPPDCLNPLDPALLGQTWVLENCDTTHVDLYNLARRTWRSVSLFARCRELLEAKSGSDCTPTAVGTDWIEFDAETPRQGDKSVFQAIATGAVHPDPTGPTTVPNLNSPALAGRVCAPLRVPREGSLMLIGRFAISDGPAGTFLERCGTRSRRSLPGLVNVYTAPGEVFWTPLPRQIDGIFLSSQQTFMITPPRDAAGIVWIAGNPHHIYLEGLTRSGTSKSWTAPAPR